MTLVLKGSTSEIEVEYSLGAVDFLVRHGVKPEKENSSSTIFRVEDPAEVHIQMRTAGLI